MGHRGRGHKTVTAESSNPKASVTLLVLCLPLECQVRISELLEIGCWPQQGKVIVLDLSALWLRHTAPASTQGCPQPRVCRTAGCKLAMDP